MSKKPLGIKGANEEEVCPECFKVVGSESRYRLVCYLGKHKEGVGVSELVRFSKLRQPTVTHHLNVLKSIDAVRVEERGKERIYHLNPAAHCFEECQIPY
jgi:DNA-binding transcriptional ArsR family regulator